MPPSSIAVIQEDPVGALSPLGAVLRNHIVHSIYIDPARCGSVHQFGRKLFEHLEQSTEATPRVNAAEKSATLELRGSYGFRASNDPRVSLHASDALPGWTVICEEEPLLALRCAPCQVYVKPLPSTWGAAFLFGPGEVTKLLAWPASEASIRHLHSATGIEQVHPLNEGP